MTLKVFWLLSLYLGSSFSQSSTSSTVGESSSIQPSPTVSASNSVTGNLIEDVSTTTASKTSGNLNTEETPSPTSVVPVQSSTVQMNTMPVVPDEQEIDEEFGPLVEELGQKISKEINPQSTKPSDVKVMKTLVPLVEKGTDLLKKYNESGNATIDYINITDSLVLVMKKFDCIEDRTADIPDRSNKSARQELDKVKDYVAMTFACPRIVINGTKPANSYSRKRRDVQIEVTMEISAVEDSGDFHEFQLLHHHSRYRRSAFVSQQCGPLKCGVQRFETSLTITNRIFDPVLQQKASANYSDFTDQLKATLERVLDSYLKVDRIHDFNYVRRSADDVKATFYLDVDGLDITEDNVTNFLEREAVNGSLEAFDVDKTQFRSTHKIVVDGNYTQWSQWGACDGNFDTKRTRNCQGAQHGGQCYGPAEEIRKCDCVYHETVGGNITSPLFPGSYPTGIRCLWILEAPVNHTVKLSLEEFQLEKDKKCFYDYMEFFDGNTTDEKHLLGDRMCGSRSPLIFESSGQMLSIVFNSDKSVTFRGFRAEWKTEKIKEKVIEYVPQYVTALTMVYSPNVNGTHYPLGTATTCTSESQTIDQECIFKEKVFIISRLISSYIDRDLSLAGGNRIVIKFEHIMNKNLFPTFYNGQKYCVSWNDKAKLQTTGGWTRRGCSVVSTNLTHTSCTCDHQGLFAVLGQEKMESSKLKLLANTYIGIGLSYFIIILAIVHIVWKIEVHGGEVMRINMCAAIIVMQSVFLIGAHVKAQQTLCGFLAFAVYFSVLAEFCWLLLHGLRIHGKIKKIFASNLNIEIVYVVIGWGLPLLLGLIAIGVQIDLKNPDDVCWEAAVGSAMWGYAGPIILIALFNVAVLLKLLIPTQDVKDGYDYEEMRFRVLKDFVFLLCFGLTCTFAYQAVEEERFLEQYLLSAFVILQALAMFVFGREGRKDFIKRVEEAKPETELETAKEEPEENIYESIELETKPEETDLGDGRVKRPRKRASNKPPEKITVSTLKNLNIYKEGGQYVIEA